MSDAIFHLGAYGFLIRTGVEILKKLLGLETELAMKIAVVVFATGLVLFLGLDPIALFGMGKLKATGEFPRFFSNVALLSGSAMGTNDILNWIRRGGDRSD